MWYLTQKIYLANGHDQKLCLNIYYLINNRVMHAQQALAPDAAPLRFAAQVKRLPLAGPKNERSGPEKGRRAARPDSVLWRRESGKAGLLTRAFSRQRSASLRSLRAAADAPIVSRPEE